MNASGRKKDKFIGCPSYPRRGREKAKTRSGLRFSILLRARIRWQPTPFIIPNHTAHPMGTGFRQRVPQVVRRRVLLPCLGQPQRYGP